MCLIFRKNHNSTECAKVHYVFYVASCVGLSVVGLFQVELHRFEPRPTCFFLSEPVTVCYMSPFSSSVY